MTETKTADTAPPVDPPAPTVTDPLPPEPKVAADAPKAADTETPDWQKPDYTGPLDINQADWRNRHIKPVDAPAHAKAAGKAKTAR